MGKFRRLLKAASFIGFLLVSTLCMAQTPDVFRLEYMLMPRNDAGAKLSRIKLVANVPIKIRDSNNIVVGGEYNLLGYDLLRSDVAGGEVFNYFHIVDLNFAYVHKYTEHWRLIGVLTPRLSSTLDRPVENGDFSINATIGAFKDRQDIDKPYRLIFGIAYNSAIPQRIPLPFVYYENVSIPIGHMFWGYPKPG